MLDRGGAVAVRDREVQGARRSDLGERDGVDRSGRVGAVDDIDLERTREALAVAAEGLAHDDVRRALAGDAQRHRERKPVDVPGVVRAAAVRVGGGPGGTKQKNDDRSREGTSDGPHIPVNVSEQENVAVRPMRRTDLDAFAAWAKHEEPLFRHYDVRPLTPEDADDLWRVLAGAPAVRRPYAAVVGGAMVGSLVVRPVGDGTGEVGIVLDPRRIGRGLGRRILAAFVVVLGAEGFGRLRLDVAGYNGRAIAAYRAAGFVTVGERWDEPEAGIDVGALLDGPSGAALAPHVRLEPDGRYRMRVVRMERSLDGTTKAGE